MNQSYVENEQQENTEHHNRIFLEDIKQACYW